ncbi:hypothetical protein CRYUN_Cryun07bG0026800 [Craigia yunnanensis]
MKLLEEYESGGVVAEACQCICDLGMPFFNHEVVKKALVKDGLDDLALDISNAKDKFSFYMEYVQNKGWLLPSLGASAVEALPTAAAS